MRRFFIDAEGAGKAEKDGLVEITGGDVKHIVNVLRMGPGDSLVFSASDGREFETHIIRADNYSVTARVDSVRLNETEPRIRVTLIQGVPKGDKMELIIQKCVELGIFSIQPVMTEHTVVKLTAAEAEKKRARWQKIAEEASKQCGRGIVPEVAPVLALGNALKARPDDELKLFAYENETELSLKTVLTAAGEDFAGELSLLIGPEGGFSAGEAETAKECGFKAFTLGKRILRTETAGFAALSGIRFFFGD